MSNLKVVPLRVFKRGSRRLKIEKRPIAIDLFAGVGGLSLGFEQAGFDVVASVEMDPIHAATHKINFPHCAMICRDVRTLSGNEIRKIANLGNRTIDVVVGGPPCQGFSLIGYRVLDDPRNSLVFHFLRLVDELRARTFVMENVFGMATGSHNNLLLELIQRFGELGYKVRMPYQILNAANFGVPQDRRRLFLLGARSNTRLPEYPDQKTMVRTSGHSRNGNGSLKLELPFCPTAEDALGDLPDVERYDSLFETDQLEIKLKGGSRYAKILHGQIEDPNDYSHPRERDLNVLTGCLRAQHTRLSRTRFSKTQPGETEPVSRFFRIALDGICNTLRAGTATDRGAFSAPRPIHPVYPRCITVREAARLHSYPDWFRFHRTIWHGFRQIGNSVPVYLGRAVGASVIKALGMEPIKPKQAVLLAEQELADFNMRQAAGYFGVDPGVIPPRKRAAAVG